MKTIFNALLIGIITLSAHSALALNSDLTLTSSSNGKVVASPAGPYLVGDQVTLTAVANDGYMFTGWSSDVTSRVNPITITMDSNKTITANFELGNPIQVHSWSNSGQSTIHTMPQFNYSEGDPSYMDTVVIPRIKAQLNDGRLPGQNILHIQGEMDDINLHGTLDDLIITSSAIQDRKIVFQNLFHKLSTAGVAIDTVVIDMEQYFTTFGLMGFRQEATCSTLSDRIQFYYDHFTGVLKDSRGSDPTLFLDPALVQDYPVDATHQPYNCTPWKGSDPTSSYYAAFNAWNKWATNAAKDAYQEAVIGPLHQYFPQAKVSQFNNTFPFPSSINNPADWPFATPIGDVASSDLYFVNTGERYSSGYRKLQKIDPWNCLIDKINLLRASLSDQSPNQPDVMPWFGYPGLSWDYTAVNEKLFDIIVSHAAQMGISQSLLWNPDSVGPWGNQAVNSNQHAAQVFATTPVNTVIKRDWSPIPFDSDSITTGSVTTTYTDFLITYNNTFTLTTTSTSGGQIQRDDVTNVMNPDQTNYAGFKWVKLSAVADSGEQFYGWIGDIESTDPIVNVPMVGPRNIKATFGPVAIGKISKDQTIVQGESVTLTVSAAGAPTLSYQWKKDGANIAGAASSSYTINPANVSDTGSYTVEVSNTYGTVTSEPTVLTVTQAPMITYQPINLTTIVGNEITFHVSALGTGPLTYQWKKNGTDISGATSADYTISSPGLADEASYRVVVSNTFGSILSDVATLAVHQPPAISVQPASVTTDEGQSATLSVTASGAGTLVYQWKKDGICINGANGPSYTINAPVSSDAGVYSVVVANAYALIQSNSAVLVVNNRLPVITTQPASLTVNEKDQAIFSVVVIGTAPLYYQWMKDGVALPGKVDDSLTINLAKGTDEGSYTVEVSNMAGNVTSDPAILTVHRSPSILSQPGSLTIDEGQPAIFSVTAAGSPTLTYQWMKDGAAIVGATNAFFTIDSTTANLAGNYTVIISNSFGTVTSTSATLTVNTSSQKIGNQPPVVSAGLDQTIVTPDSTTLSGTVSDDGLPNPPKSITTMWNVVTAPGTVTFGDPHSLITKVSFSGVGTYVLSLTANDGSLTSVSKVSINVVYPLGGGGGGSNLYTLMINASNGRVTRNPNQASYTTATQVTLTATANDGYQFVGWSGDAQGSSNPLKITMDNNKTVTALFKATNQRQSNQPPSVSAGTDQIIDLKSTALLLGTVTDDGLPIPPASMNTTWSVISGAGAVNFANINAPNTTATFSLPGRYVLQLTANDGALQASSTVSITVSAVALYSLKINAGKGRVYRTPDSSKYTAGTPVTLIASAPPGYRFSSWSGDITGNTDTITITMDSNKTILANFSSSNEAPVVIANVDHNVVNLPDPIQLKGEVSDDGLPSKNLRATWSKVSGPGNVRFADPSSENTTATFSKAGVYVLQLSANDGLLEAKAAVSVTVLSMAKYSITTQATHGKVTKSSEAESYSEDSRVTLTAVPENGYLFSSWSGDLKGNSNPVTIALKSNMNIIANFVEDNQPPWINAGPNQTIALSERVILRGSTTENEGAQKNLKVIWCKLSGPGIVTYANANSLITTASFSKEGKYVLLMTAINPKGLSTNSKVTITVKPSK